MNKVTGLALSLALLGTSICTNSAAGDALLEGFRSPPVQARPRVWWHWMNGNVTQDGIAKDIAWMKRVGIGGLQNFDANLATPQVVSERLVYMQPGWRDAFRFAASQALAAGLELAIPASPGWSETGGPWVPPRDGLKKLVWSETVIHGGERFAGRLTAPPAATGPYQDLVAVDALAGFSGEAVKAPPAYYADVAVLAIPLSESADAASLPVFSASGRRLDASVLTDGRGTTGLDVETGTPQSPGIVSISYPEPHAVRSVTLSLSGATVPFGDPLLSPVLEVNDGRDWQKIADLPVSDVPVTASFAPVIAREFRLRLLPYGGPRRQGLGEGAAGSVLLSMGGGAPASTVRIAELQLRAEPRIDRFEFKAGFAVALDYYALGDGTDGAAPAVAPGDIINLTSRMKPDGTLDWQAPAGHWRVLRLGYSLTGVTNHPAIPEATGLEVDKYDAAAVRRYLETYLGNYRDTLRGDLPRHGLRALLTDSIEVGPSNWTPRLIAQFKRLRGYDPLPWLPTLTGTIIGSREQSDAFLYDFRRTLADLISSEHYATVARVAHEHGLTWYGEALEDTRPLLGDDMAMRVHTDVPMAALWTYDRASAPRSTLLGDMKGAASVAHVYGKQFVAAESLTAINAPWAFAPADLRRIVDLEFAYGINRPVIHTSVHQPLDDRLPGLSLAIFGQYFNRHETWAEMARPWMDYIARSSYLLQQGRDVADVAYFYGEEQPLTALFAPGPITDTPVRYAYDFVNAAALANRLTVDRNGALSTTSGAVYRLLYLGGTSGRMTLSTLRRIAALAQAGATVVGNPPQSSPGLKDDAAEFKSLVQRLWPGTPGAKVGKGTVIADRDVESALADMRVPPDFTYAGQQAGEVLFVHRRIGTADIYFLDNRRNRATNLEARFRITGRAPEIWRADTGSAGPVSYRVEGYATVVPLHFDAEESLFIVFRRRTNQVSAEIVPRDYSPLAQLAGDWDVAFQEGRAAPAATRFASLHSLSDDPDTGIKYFSGTTTYTKTFEIPAHTLPGDSLLLDLGRVGEVAEVRVNGTYLGTVWKAPYRLDIGAATRNGVNQLEVRVANLWVNRLIGDMQPGAQKITFTTVPTYRPDAPLRPSGLLGPVSLGSGER